MKFKINFSKNKYIIYDWKLDYPAVRDGYLKHGDGFLLVFDITNRETFESIKNHR